MTLEQKIEKTRTMMAKAHSENIGKARIGLANANREICMAQGNMTPEQFKARFDKIEKARQLVLKAQAILETING